jgi:hypothetical protein
MKYNKEILIIILLAMMMQSCSSRKTEPVSSPINEYSTSLCSWLRPYYGVDGNFEEQVPVEVLKMMLRNDQEFNAVCLKLR